MPIPAADTGQIYECGQFTRGKRRFFSSFSEIYELMNKAAASPK